MSLPAVFPPVAMNNQVLVDGGAVDNIPADVVRDMGAAVVIAVNVGDLSDKSRIANHVAGSYPTFEFRDTLESVVIVDYSNKTLTIGEIDVVNDLAGTDEPEVRIAPAGGQTRAADAIDFSEVDLAAGYDYNALILATQEGAAAFDPRYGMDDLFNPGLQGQFSVKFIF